MNNKKNKILSITLFIIILLLIVIKNIYNNKSLEKSSNYTIGNVISIKPNGNAGYRIYFTYKVNNNTYEAYGGIYEYNKNLIGEKYFVKFSPSNPKNCKILLDKKVPENITKAPLGGWDSIPE